MKKIALVTGASKGIGRATALLLASHGYDVAINYLKNQKCAERLCRDVEAMGQRAICWRANVANETEVTAMFKGIDDFLGPITVLVNNAGILLQQTNFMGISAQRLVQIMNINVTGLVLCSQQAILRMSQEYGGQGGSIVNVSSAAAKTGAPNEYIDYAASKGAVDTITIGMAKELAGQDIRVNGVRPALIYTDMHASGGEPDRVANRAGNIPLGRGGTPEEVAEAIYWLASEKSSFTTGRFIDVDGGI